MVKLPALLLLALLSGCSTPYKYPCEFDAHFRIDHEWETNEACHNGPGRLVNDQGRRLGPADKVYGCADTARGILYARDVDSTIIHEVKHFKDRFCR